MTGRILDGKAVAARVRTEVSQRVTALAEKGIVPCLAVVLAGDDPASAVYVRNKEKAASKAGIRFVKKVYPGSVSTEELIKCVDELARDDAVHAILVQLPLPRGVDESAILARIPQCKDADGFCVSNTAACMKGCSGTRPCTPAGVMRLLQEYDIPVEGKHAVIIGRSQIVGRPMAMMLLEKNATVTICHSRTPDIAVYTRDADIVVCAVGKSGMMKPDMLKEGCVLIDVGINRLADGTIAGDAEKDCLEKAGWMTPVPGGVGPMTIAMLLNNTVALAEMKNA